MGINLEFLNKGYINQEGILDENLITKHSRYVAEYLVNERLTATQLRAFFNDIKSLENKINWSKEEKIQVDYNSIYPMVLMLEAKAEYKYRNGKNAKITEGFRDLIKANVNVLKDKKVETFRNFTKFFETIVAYYYGYGGK
jgi:CRISPR-associated protein Csm2